MEQSGIDCEGEYNFLFLRQQYCQIIPALLLWHLHSTCFIDIINTIKMVYPLLETCLPGYSFVDIDIIMPACPLF